MTATADNRADNRDQTFAQVMMFVTPAMFCTNMLVARYSAEFIPPVALAVWRWLGVFILLLPFCGVELWRQRRYLAKDAGRLLVLGALGMGICGAVVYAAGKTTTATNIGLIYAVSPVVIIMLSRVMFHDRMTMRQILGTALALTGMLAIVAKGDPAVFLHLSFVPGDLMILAAAIAWALYSVLLKRWPSLLSINARLASIAIAGVAVMLPFLVWETATVGPITPDFRTLATLATVILIAGIGAYASHGYITKHLGPNKAGLILYLSPVYNAVLAWLLLGEQLAVYHWIGAALVLPGLYVATTRSGKT
ncbi:DMT family transporter [uncultured Ferrovibrio sp.]|jgi:Permeases of the drug/metabolite transporter (DMT) superfamily|uniref:DMT family transporter n=1 Tax=uncultured Ferrovibrio sp. TaxID=1576913 RepID=UPI0026185201|nr:DMT family transporter [uncultured Ferrovibrio sp.]